MKPKGIFLIAFAILLPRLAGQQAEDLAKQTADYIHDFFKDLHAVSAAVTSLENRSSLAPTALERTYQLIYSHLVEFNNNRFLDLLIDFEKDQARFNLSKAYQLQYLIQLKFIQNRANTGVGITIYSRRLDRIVGIHYVEAPIGDGEKSLLAIHDFAVKDLGFAKKTDLEIKANLLDVAGADIGGTPLLFFFYPGEILIFKTTEQGLEKKGELKLKWGPPYYPSLHDEGRLGLWQLHNSWIMTAGANFCPQAKLFTLSAAMNWQESDSLPFVPLGHILLNGKEYLAGGAYDWGENYFSGKLLFSGVKEAGLDKQSLYERQVPAFFALAFSSGNDLQAVHMIDRTYQYSCLAADFTTPILQLPHKGGALAMLDNQWLAMSDYSSGKDRVFFFKIEGGTPKLAYENPLNAEIRFIAAGRWRSQKGFWLCLQKMESGSFHEVLEFWSKSDE